MRILLTVHQFLPKRSGGTEVLTRDTGLEMLARGHEVHVLTVDPDARRKSTEIGYEDYEYRGLKVHVLRLPRRRSMSYLIEDEYNNDLVAEHVRGYTKLVEPDAVHMFHLSRISGSVIEVFRDLYVPVVFTPTDFWAICVRLTLTKPSGELSTGPDEISSNCLECWGVERFLPPEELPDTSDRQEMYRRIADRSLSKSENEHPNMVLVRAMLDRTRFLRESVNTVDAILAPTKLMHRTLVANGIDSRLVTVSPYGIDVSDFQRIRRPRSDPEKLRIGYIGAINPQKGLHILLESFKRLPGETGASLRICGNLGAWPDYAQRVYAQAGNDNRINFAGPFPNEKMTDELEKIDVLVVPSTWYENAPLVVYSALAAGIPVVGSNQEGIAEIIDDKKNGLLFKSGDPEDLTRQLKRLITEPALLAQLRGNGGNVRTVEDSVDEMLDLYKSLQRNANT